jgi:hypothetical protein
MATRKKKESVKLTIPNAIGAAKIEVGTHLTVYTYDDGRTELLWDDEQLLKEVREAIASVETNKKTVAKKAPEKKVAAKTPAEKTTKKAKA